MAWLNGFSNRFKLTIAADDVGSTLSNFPVLIRLASDSGRNDFDATAVFDELGDVNQRKIAVTIADGTTQCPVEIQSWDAVTEEAFLWTKVPSVYASSDTELYFYYDASYSGTVGITISGTTVSGNHNYVAMATDTSYEMVVNINSEGTYDTVHARKPCVIKESDTSYKMWYGAYENSTSKWRILYCTSIDGTSWTGHQMVVDYNQTAYDTQGAFQPCVIKESDTSYKMWYAGSTAVNNRILYATSTNGTSWSNYQLVVNISSEGTYDTSYAEGPCIIKESDTSYKMWYSGYDSTYFRGIYCVSSNGTTWSGFQMVLNRNSEGTYDTNYARPSTVFKDGNLYRMWYTGSDGSNNRILYAESYNGTTWGNFEKVMSLNVEGTYDTNHVSFPWVLSDDLNRMWYGAHDGTNYRILESRFWKNPVWDVWDDYFVYVCHMEQNPEGEVYDSTSYQHNATSGGDMSNVDLVDGVIGKQIEFDGANDYLDCGNPGILQLTSNFCAEAYITSNNFSTHNPVVQKWQFANNAGWGIRVQTDGTIRIGFRKSSGDYYGVYNSIPTVVDTSYYVAFYYPGNGSVPTLFVDGVSKYLTIWLSVGGALNGITDSGQSMTIGRGGLFATSTYNYCAGKVEEVRISNTERTPDWIWLTRYSNLDEMFVYEDGATITTDWLGTWSKRIKLTIDSDKVDSPLGNYPVCVTLSSGTGITNVDVTNIFTTISGSNKKIAVTTEDGITQCYVETEYWSASEQTANLWVKVPLINAAEDTILYLYYDSSQSDNTSYVGDTTDTAAQNVWDDHYIGVWHMSQDPNGDASNCILDSTSNAYHGTPTGTMTTDDLVDGLIGKAIEFDGSNDRITTTCPGVLGASDRTTELIVEPQQIASGGFVYWGYYTPDGEKWNMSLDSTYGYTRVESQGGNYLGSTNIYGMGWVSYVATFTGGDVSTDTELYVNGTKEVESSSTAHEVRTGLTTNTNVTFGAQNSSGWIYLHSKVCDVRISNVVRNDAWIKAGYYVNNNNFITFGSEENIPIFTFDGYVQVEGAPAARTVHLFRRSTGELIDTTVSSSSNGYFILSSFYNDYHFIVILPELTESYNLLSYDKINPGA